MAFTISATTINEVDPDRNASAEVHEWMLTGSIGSVDLSKMNSVSNPTRKSTSQAVLASLSNK